MSLALKEFKICVGIKYNAFILINPQYCSNKLTYKKHEKSNKIFSSKIPKEF